MKRDWDLIREIFAALEARDTTCGGLAPMPSRATERTRRLFGPGMPLEKPPPPRAGHAAPPMPQSCDAWPLNPTVAALAR
jgi:hypothetical protein